VLPIIKRLAVLFWTFLQISRQPNRIRKNQDPEAASSRTSLASRTVFEVLDLGLEG